MCRCLAQWSLPAFCFLLVTGCSNTPQDKGEDEVRETFQALQAALKIEDADKVWNLLDTDSQGDAETRARTIRSDYKSADAQGKRKQEKELGLAGAELRDLTGKGFLKTKRFLGKYDEIPGSTIDSITVRGNGATVAYTEPDLDREKLALVRQKGKWKVTLPMPK